MPLTVREVIRLLERHGWVEMRSRGSHRHFKHPDRTFVVTCAGQRRQRTCARDAKRYTQEGRAEMSARRYSVVIERTGTGYSAYSPDVPGCAAVGESEDETLRNFQDALTEHFQVMREVGEPIPEPHTSVDYVEVAAII
jgi:predicted RNase H-like HicB family nuclease/predicted RNA binding protein YcfA (HicA-like mRNA interferase family)